MFRSTKSYHDKHLLALANPHPKLGSHQDPNGIHGTPKSSFVHTYYTVVDKTKKRGFDSLMQEATLKLSLSCFSPVNICILCSHHPHLISRFRVFSILKRFAPHARSSHLDPISGPGWDFTLFQKKSNFTSTATLVCSTTAIHGPESSYWWMHFMSLWRLLAISFNYRPSECISF